MGVKKKKASLSYKEAWEKEIAIKQNIALGLSVLSFVIALIVILIN